MKIGTLPPSHGPTITYAPTPIRPSPRPMSPAMRVNWGQLIWSEGYEALPHRAAPMCRYPSPAGAPNIRSVSTRSAERA